MDLSLGETCVSLDELNVKIDHYGARVSQQLRRKPFVEIWKGGLVYYGILISNKTKKSYDIITY